MPKPEKNLLEYSKKSNDAPEVKNGLETLYCVVGERPGLRIIFIYIIYIFNLHDGNCTVII